MLNYKWLAPFFCLLALYQTASSQSSFSNELGIIAGPVQFRSDFGRSNDMETNFKNSGIGIGIVHYMNFSYRRYYNYRNQETYFNDHFKIRNEISWNKTNLDHHGYWVQPSKVSVEANQLRGQHGVAQNLDIGTQLEYYPLSIRSFESFGYRIAPFVSLGVHYTFFNPQASTTFANPDPNAYGDVFDRSNIYTPWFENFPVGSGTYPINVDGGSTWSTVASVGIRYKLDKMSDLMLDLRGQYFFSDWVDGLNHNWRHYDKHNDWLLWLNVGYIFYLD